LVQQPSFGLIPRDLYQHDWHLYHLRFPPSLSSIRTCLYPLLVRLTRVNAVADGICTPSRLGLVASGKEARLPVESRHAGRRDAEASLVGSDERSPHAVDSVDNHNHRWPPQVLLRVKRQPLTPVEWVKQHAAMGLRAEVTQADCRDIWEMKFGRNDIETVASN